MGNSYTASLKYLILVLRLLNHNKNKENWLHLNIPSLPSPSMHIAQWSGSQLSSERGDINRSNTVINWADRVMARIHFFLMLLLLMPRSSAASPASPQTVGRHELPLSLPLFIVTRWRSAQLGSTRSSHCVPSDRNSWREHSTAKILSRKLRIRLIIPRNYAHACRVTFRYYCTQCSRQVAAGLCH